MRSINYGREKNKFEMLSSYVDGELNEAESAEILEMLQSDSELRQRLRKYSLLSGLINLDRSDNAEPQMVLLLEFSACLNHMPLEWPLPFLLLC